MNKSIKIGSYLLITFLIILSYLMLQTKFTHTGLISADTISFTSLYQDLALYHYPIKGWMLSSAPYYFPDIFYHLVVSFLTGNSLIALFTFQLFEIIILTLLFILINIKLYPNDYHITVIPCILFTTFLIKTNVGPNTAALFFSITAPYSHLSCWISVFACLYLIISFWNRTPAKWMQIFFFIFTALITFSDMLFLVSFFPPLLATALFFYFKKIDAPHKIILNMAAGSLAGLLLSFLQPFHSHSIYPPFKVFLNFISTWGLFLKGDLIFFTPLWIISVGLILYFTYYFFFKLTVISQRLNHQQIFSSGFLFIILFTVSNLFCLLSAIIINGYYTDGFFSFHYVTSIFLLPVFIGISYLATYFYRSRTEIGLFFIFLFLTLFMGGKAFISTNLVYRLGWLSYIAPEAKCVDTYANLLPTKYGLSQYWRAKLVTVFSQTHQWVNQVTPDGHVRWWLNNAYWYLQDNRNKKQFPKYSYVLVDHVLQLDDVQKLFGKPNQVVACQNQDATNFKILIYNTPQSIATLNQKFLERNARFFNAFK